MRPILLVGGIGAGKTSTGLRLLSLLRQSRIPVGGFLSPRLMRGDETVGYSLIDLTTNATHPFANLEPSDVRIGRFFVPTQSLATADRIVTAALDETSVVFLDEVGRLELQGNGHAPAVRRLLASEALPILLVRDDFVDQVTRTFGIEDPVIFRVEDARDACAPSRAGASTFWEIVDSIPYPLLITHGEDGFPQSRPMYLIERSDTVLWFPTSRASRKIPQIEGNPYVSVLFVDSVRFNYASFHGRAQVVVNPEKEQRLWRDEWRDDWPEGPSDPDYVLLKVVGIRGSYLRGTTGETGTIDLTASDAA